LCYNLRLLIDNIARNCRLEKTPFKIVADDFAVSLSNNLSNQLLTLEDIDANDSPVTTTKIRY